LGNQFLYQDRQKIYRAMTNWLIKGVTEPVILIDWSPLCPDQSQQLLRAAIPVGGRSLTLYEEIHSQRKLGNRGVQHRFLERLSDILPANCRPIIVADAGFRTPFYRYVQETLQWHWVGRIRGSDHLCELSQNSWFAAKSWYSKATTRPRRMGVINWVRSQPLISFIVLVRQPRKGRRASTFKGETRRAKRDQVHQRREKEPWLLVASLSLQKRTPKQIVNLYRSRVQIEEGFRDCKAIHYGLGMAQHNRMKTERRANLCLIAALANILLWRLVSRPNTHRTRSRHA
jgi:hypothetical protein